VGFLHVRLNRKRASASAGLPVARSEELVVEAIAEEVLVYDQRTDQAHCLGSVAARVWRACDGATTVEQLSVFLGLDAGTVARALEELEQCGLLDAAPQAGLTRREATARLAKVGAAAASAPLIYSIAAPTPALAASQAFCTAHPCTSNAGTCHALGCVDCHVGNQGICAADCTAAHCSAAIINPICGSAVSGTPACG
jgi:DNA-binding transcriptional regulator YhcF (GntR family)